MKVYDKCNELAREIKESNEYKEYKKYYNTSFIASPIILLTSAIITLNFTSLSK